jgi:endonuclease/exonuclease/phosphatase family metal-dependent hydrolase
MKFKCVIFFVFLLTNTILSFGREIRIVTWNARELFNVDSVTIRSRDFYRFSKTIKPDILCLEEVTSYKVVEAIRDAMHLKGYYVACSDFQQRDDQRYNAFEVAIISKYPFSHVLEYDPIPDNIEKVDPPEIALQPSWELGMPALLTYRGFLWVKIENPKATIVVTHLKSSRGYVGENDLRNARQREFVTAAIAKSVLQDQFYFPEYANIVCGDFNVGHSDSLKNGVDLENDFTILGDGDLYDDTHAILGGGLINGLRLRNAGLSITESTFPRYPGSPIDNIYVGGIFVDFFYEAKTTSEDTFGSDHKPVWIDWRQP